MLKNTKAVRKELAERLRRIAELIEKGVDIRSLGTDFDVLASYIQADEDLTDEFLGRE